MRTRFVGAQVIDGTGAPARTDLTVEIAGERIIALDAQGGDRAGPDVDTVDARGLTLLPGLIDGHVHLLLEPDVENPVAWERALHDPDATLLQRGAAAAARLLASGVTTARDCGGRGTLTIALRDAIRRGDIAGPRILASGRAITRTGGHGQPFGIAADDGPALRRAADELIDQGVDCLKVMATGGNLSAGSRPELAQYSSAELAEVVATAHARGRRVTAHAHAPAGIANALDAGIDSIEHCSWIGADGRAYDPALVARIARAPVHVDLTPAVSYRVVTAEGAAWRALGERLRRVREIRVPTMLPMWEAGVRLYLGSDAGTPLTSFGDFALVLEVSVRDGGLPARAVIAAATGTAAEALGIAEETGTIAVGKIADLLLVAGDPLHDIRALRQVRRVYRAGRLVGPRGAGLADLRGANGQSSRPGEAPPDRSV